jgi:hydroxymethylglutaryl-CoA reductase (NADPH)
MSHAVASVLDTIAALNPLDPTMSPVDVLVKVAPPLHINAIPSSQVPPRVLFRSSELIDNFMSGWTNLVGDPVISKWIVSVLPLV